MAKVGARDLTNFYDFGPQNDPTNPELSHRMYFDLSTTIGNNVLMVADQAFNIISEYQGWPASLIVGVGTPIVSKSDICVLNDQGLNSFPPVANRVNPIYRMYIAKRPITVNIPNDEATEYECSLLIVNQRFEIEYIVPLLEGFVPFETLSAGAICCSYDYGFNAQSTDQNYIWHMYVSDYTVDPGTEFEQIIPNCLLIVNRDFKVECYQTPLP